MKKNDLILNINKSFAQRPELSSLSQHSAAWSVCPSQVLFQIIILVTRSSSCRIELDPNPKNLISIHTHPSNTFQRSPSSFPAPPMSSCLGSPAPLWSWQSLLTDPRGKKRNSSCVIIRNRCRRSQRCQRQPREVSEESLENLGGGCSGLGSLTTTKLRFFSLLPAF